MTRQEALDTYWMEFLQTVVDYEAEETLRRQEYNKNIKNEMLYQYPTLGSTLTLEQRFWNWYMQEYMTPSGAK